MKTGPDDLGNTENEYGRPKHVGADSLDTAEHESERGKHENRT
jgi:hypothetical protein